MRVIITYIVALLLVLGTVEAYSITYNWNDLKSQDVTEVLAYSWGYNNGYNDAEKGQAQQPFTLVNKWRRIYVSDPDYLGSELAYKEKGFYTKGYRDGHSDASHGRLRAVEKDFIEQYDRKGVLTIVKEATKTVAAEKKAEDIKGEAISGWDFDALDTSSVANLGYSVGYDDARAKKSKAPMKLTEDLAKSKKPNIGEFLKWIRADRGTYIKKYREGYEAYGMQTAEKITKTSTQGKKSYQPSQQSGKDQTTAAWDLGYNLGYAKVMAGEASAPQEIDNYEWLIDSRYIDLPNEYSDYYWYAPPIIAGITLSRTDVETFYADETSYLKGYRQGYSIGKDELAGNGKEMTDAEYVWQLGCQIAKEGGNVYTYNWIQRRYAVTTEDLDMVKLVRYNRAELYKGYKACR